MRLVPAFAALAFLTLATACKPAAEVPVDATAVAPELTTVMPVDAPPQEEIDPALAPAVTLVPTIPAAEPGSCLEGVGAAAAARLVERCIQVSPATHPPCNAQNSCAMIRDEIDRACAMYGPDETRPPECTA
ncbi:MAG: hypothetical protein ACI9YM_000221 [Brevundimonas sp.]|jgi:hypothetical protein|uniref:hypothetical protein n=1 Tax=Brevundimonas sp. TaxID=1871086 RepID=UPI002488D5D0|nr:hypothetical protein [Brevundimonas sp.]MDI1280343.1 hypothetical protein [Brevundimonas sp.]